MFCVQYIRQLHLSPVVTHCLVLGSQLSTLRFRPLVSPPQRDHPRSTIFLCQVAIPPLYKLSDIAISFITRVAFV